MGVGGKLSNNKLNENTNVHMDFSISGSCLSVSRTRFLCLR
jgi:hypothetical protein